MLSISNLSARIMRRKGVRLLSVEHLESINSWSSKYRVTINSLMRHIAKDIKFNEEVESMNLDSSSWNNFLNSFRRGLIKEPLQILGSEERLNNLRNSFDRLSAALDSSDGSEAKAFEESSRILFDNVLNKALTEMEDVVTLNQALKNISDMRAPHEWYPETRLTRRKIIYHAGPTNSGKTYQALTRLREADPEKGGGLYCGPLRLLALEVYEQLNRQGVFTNLLTGQEKREVPGSTHISSTLEMVSLQKEYDVAVIDEIQMIADRDRGHAWTRALLGLNANEIHICGGAEACDIVQDLMDITGDDFTIQRYERLSTLKLSERSLCGDYSKVQPGDCIVAFSVKDIFSIRREIEKTTPYKCAVIYGRLPPETRSTQARLFNEENTGYDILIASDAIGMGLNLNIRRIIFHTTLKMAPRANGLLLENDDRRLNLQYIEPTLLKQIAGRAGRLSSKYDYGEVTSWQEVDLAYIKAVMAWDIPNITNVGIFPSIDQVQYFSDQMQHALAAASAQRKSIEEEDEEGFLEDSMEASREEMECSHDVIESLIDRMGANEESKKKKKQNKGNKNENNEIENSLRLSLVFDRYVKESRMDSQGKYFLCNHSDISTAANWLHSIPLSITDRFIFATAPANNRSATEMKFLYQYAATYALHRPVPSDIRISQFPPDNFFKFTDLCSKHNILDLYIWLSIRYPNFFIEGELCKQQKKFALGLIEKTLNSNVLAVKYTHLTDYEGNRNSLESDHKKNAGIDCLPNSEEYKPIKQSFIDFLDKIPFEQRFIVPNTISNSKA